MAEELELERVGAEYAHELEKLGTFGVLVDGGRVVRLDELTALELGAVQRSTGIPWAELLADPTVDLLGALALVEACEAHADVSRSRVGTVTVLELLERVVRLAPVLEVVPEAQPGAQ